MGTAASAKRAEADGKIEVFPIGIGEANLNRLAELSRRPPMMADGLKFRELFVGWSSLGQSPEVRQAKKLICRLQTHGRL